MPALIGYWLVALLWLSAADAFAQALPPASEFAALPATAFVRLSPDGSKIAWVNDQRGDPIVVVFDLVTGKEVRRVKQGDTKIRDLDWSDDKTLVITISTTIDYTSIRGRKQYEIYRYAALDIATGDARSLLLRDPERQYVIRAYIVSLRPRRPGVVLMSSFDFFLTKYRRQTGRLAGGDKDSGWLHSIFEVDTRTGMGKTIDQGSSFTRKWVVDQQGRPVARSEWNPETDEHTILARGEKGWRSIHVAKNDFETELDGIAADGQSILIRSTRGTDKAKIWSIPLTGGDMTLVYEHPKYSVESTITDRFTELPVGFRIADLTPTIHWVDPKMDAIQKVVERAFPDRSVEVIDRSEDYRRVLARVRDSSHAPVYYLVDLAKGAADIIGDAYPGLADARLGDQAAISYVARDGETIPAYLTMPPGRESAHLPLVVLLHSNLRPARETDFRWLANFLATRGYVVLEPGFRGSGEFTAALRGGGDRQWGSGLQDDINDGVRYLVSKGTADPKRICIVGSSYGGYAALAGAVYAPELYACAASINGISNFPAYFGYVSGRSSDWLKNRKHYYGNPSDDAIANFSPIRSLQTISAPIMLIHAIDDTNVPLSQSQYFAQALKESGKTHNLVSISGDHGLSTTNSRRAVVQALEQFLGPILLRSE